jgi:hypothetical protein
VGIRCSRTCNEQPALYPKTPTTRQTTDHRQTSRQRSSREERNARQILCVRIRTYLVGVRSATNTPAHAYSLLGLQKTKVPKLKGIEAQAELQSSSSTYVSEGVGVREHERRAKTKTTTTTTTTSTTPATNNDNKHDIYMERTSDRGECRNTGGRRSEIGAQVERGRGAPVAPLS